MTPQRFSNLILALILAGLTGTVFNLFCCTYDTPEANEYPDEPTKCPGKLVCGENICKCQSWAVVEDAGNID